MTKEQEEKIDKIVENMSDKEIEDRIRQDEQEEAIERLKRIDVKFFISGMNEVSNYIIDEADKVNNAIETILSMLKEKDTEIKKKDKQIDLMTEFLGERDLGYYKNETGGEIFGIMRQYNKEDWKKYFERKSEE